MLFQAEQALIAGFRKAVHVRLPEYAKALSGFVQVFQAKIVSTDFQIEPDGFRSLRAFGELALMALKNGIQLFLQVSVRDDVAGRLCGHIKGNGFYRSSVKPVARHNLLIRCKTHCPLCCFSDVEMIAVALTGDRRIRAENHIRLKVADHSEDCFK